MLSTFFIQVQYQIFDVKTVDRPASRPAGRASPRRSPAGRARSPARPRPTRAVPTQGQCSLSCGHRRRLVPPTPRSAAQPPTPPPIAPALRSRLWARPQVPRASAPLALPAQLLIGTTRTHPAAFGAGAAIRAILCAPRAARRSPPSPRLDKPSRPSNLPMVVLVPLHSVGPVVEPV